MMSRAVYRIPRTRKMERSDERDKMHVWSFCCISGLEKRYPAVGLHRICNFELYPQNKSGKDIFS